MFWLLVSQVLGLIESLAWCSRNIYCKVGKITSFQMFSRKLWHLKLPISQISTSFPTLVVRTQSCTLTYKYFAPLEFWWYLLNLNFFICTKFSLPNCKKNLWRRVTTLFSKGNSWRVVVQGSNSFVPLLRTDVMQFWNDSDGFNIVVFRKHLAWLTGAFLYNYQVATIVTFARNVPCNSITGIVGQILSDQVLQLVGYFNCIFI